MKLHQPYPRKLYIEPTTRCNFRCEMCVKQSPGNEISEGDLTVDVFDHLLPVMPHMESVVFSGIGEAKLLNKLIVL